MAVNEEMRQDVDCSGFIGQIADMVQMTYKRQVTSDNAYRVGRPYIGNGLPIMHHSQA